MFVFLGGVMALVGLSSDWVCRLDRERQASRSDTQIPGNDGVSGATLASRNSYASSRKRHLAIAHLSSAHLASANGRVPIDLVCRRSVGDRMTFGPLGSAGSLAAGSGNAPAFSAHEIKSVSHPRRKFAWSLAAVICLRNGCGIQLGGGEIAWANCRSWRFQAAAAAAATLDLHTSRMNRPEAAYRPRQGAVQTEGGPT